MTRKMIVLGVVGLAMMSAGWTSELVSRAEFEKVNSANQQEFKNISVTLAEIKTELTHLNQDLAELKDLRRNLTDRLIDFALAGGLAFSGSLAWKNRRNGRKNGSTRSDSSE
jgi:hypothetical protein